ncbi:MAG: hypothetical protein RRB13_02235 [bacterium]|nr:hypothetical protein [bacterium]
MRAAAVLTLLLLSLPWSVGLAEPNPYESRVIRKQILQDFKNLMDMWKEELYFEMYDSGQRASRQRLSKGEFAQRMVDLGWKPSLKAEDIRSLDILYRNYASIHVRMEFENKINPTRKLLKDMVLSAILEGEKDRSWRFDLTQLIRVPYAGKFVDLEAEKNEAEARKRRTEEEAKRKAEEAVRAWAQRKKDMEEGKVVPTPEDEARLAAERAANEKKAAENTQP